MVPFFTDDTAENTTRAWDLSVESEEDMSRYIMPLPEDKRRTHGSPTRTTSTCFPSPHWTGPTSLLLTRLLSIVRCLYTKRSRFRNERLREYCHEKFCSASDVDLFLYGLTHEQAIDKSQADRTGSQGCSTQCGHCRSYQIRLSLPLPVSILFAISRFVFIPHPSQQ